LGSASKELVAIRQDLKPLYSEVFKSDSGIEPAVFEGLGPLLNKSITNLMKCAIFSWRQDVVDVVIKTLEGCEEGKGIDGMEDAQLWPAFGTRLVSCLNGLKSFLKEDDVCRKLGALTEEEAQLRAAILTQALSFSQLFEMLRERKYMPANKIKQELSGTIPWVQLSSFLGEDRFRAFFKVRLSVKSESEQEG